MLKHKEPAQPPAVKRGRERKTNRQGHGTIEDIYEACMKILIEEGSAKLTFDRISQVSGMSKGTLVYHFPSKASLMEYLIERYRDRLAGKLAEGCRDAEKSDSPIKDPLVAGFFEWYSKFRREPAVNTAYGLSLLSLTAKNEKMRAVMQKWYAELFESLKDSPTGSESLIAVLALEGLFYLRHFQVDMIDDEELDKALELIFKRCS